MIAWKLARDRRAMAAAVAGLSTLLPAALLLAYNTFQDQVNGAVYPPKWQNNSVTWELNPTAGANINTTGGVSLQTAVTSAFTPWQQATFSGQTLDSIAVTQGPNSSLNSPNTGDCVNVIGFDDMTTSDFSTGTVAFTEVATSAGAVPHNTPCGFVCNLQSCMIDADIEFNPADNFSTTAPPLSGDFDVQAIATHEIGHLLGLDHSGIAHAVMYPFGDTGQSQQRTLATDDVMGISFLYPSPAFAGAVGTISGQVTLNGSGIYAAHIVAIDATTGNAVLDGLSAPNGTYALIGVPAGTYNVLVVPLTGAYTLSNFSGWSAGYSSNTPHPTNYTGKFY